MTELNGRPVYTRADLIARHGMSYATLEKWERDRATTGYPEPIAKLNLGKAAGQPWAWDAHEWDTWHAARLAQTTKPSSTRTGNADDLITLSEAARILGVKPTSITKYPTRPPTGWPEPATADKTPGGNVRRRYRRADIWAYQDLMALPYGARDTDRQPAPRQRRWPFDGDPRLHSVRAILATTPANQHAHLLKILARQHPSTSPATWTRILAQAKEHPTE